MVQVFLLCLMQYVFEGVVGISYLSDIALDDIKVYPGPCEGKSY